MSTPSDSHESVPVPADQAPVAIHDDRDVDTTIILRTAGVMVGSFVVIFLLCWALFDWFKHSDTVAASDATNMAIEDSQRSFNARRADVARRAPILDGLSRVDDDKKFARTNPEPDVYTRPVLPSAKMPYPSLEDYGSAREKGYVRVPIETAMRLILEKNRLSVAEPKARVVPPGPILNRPSSSNSGRGAKKGNP